MLICRYISSPSWFQEFMSILLYSTVVLLMLKIDLITQFSSAPNFFFLLQKAFRKYVYDLIYNRAINSFFVLPPQSC